MDREDLTLLLTHESMALMEQFADLDSTKDALGAITTLRKQGVDARTSAAILTQLKLRRRAGAKFGQFAERMLFTEDGLAQATRLQVAAHHAERFRAAGSRRIADLGCGIGADSMTFAALGLEVFAVDADEVTAAIATHNLAPFPGTEVRHARAEDVDLTGFDAAFLDPARRKKTKGATDRGASHRLADPADWQPSLDFAFGLVDAPTPAVGVKLGPAFPHESIPEAAEAQWVSVAGELVECAVWLGTTRRDGIARSALVISKGAGTHEITSPAPAEAAQDAPVGELGEWLHEPDPAIIRGRFIGDVARQLGGHMIANDIAWISTAEQASTPLAQSFRVLEQFKLDRSLLKKELRARGIGTLEIKVRGVDLDPAQLRPQLALKGDAAATLICTRLGDRRVAILAERVRD